MLLSDAYVVIRKRFFFPALLERSNTEGIKHSSKCCSANDQRALEAPGISKEDIGTHSRNKRSYVDGFAKGLGEFFFNGELMLN